MPKRRSRRRCSSPSKLVPPRESCQKLLRFRLILRDFLRSMAESVSDASFFTIRGMHMWSLCLNLAIENRFYSALLLACDLVDTSRSSVSLKIEAWRDFLVRYHLAPEGKVIEGHCEITEGNINYSSLKDTRQMHSPRKSKKMQLLRIGKYAKKGETVKATMQINDGAEPPFFNSKQRTAQRKLVNETRDIISEYYFSDKIKEVMQWVNMEDIYITENDSIGNDDDGDGDDDDDDSAYIKSGSEDEDNDNYSYDSSEVDDDNSSCSSCSSEMEVDDDKEWDQDINYDALSPTARKLVDKLIEIGKQYQDTKELLMKELSADDSKYQMETSESTGGVSDNNANNSLPEIKAAKIRLKTLRSERKAAEHSLYTGVERILEDHQIFRASYHGGDFNGRDIRKLMDGAQDIMNEIKDFLLQNKRSSASNEEISQLCDNISLALMAWNEVFALANTKYDSLEQEWVEKHCNKAEVAITKAMKLMRKMGFSITPKLHALECHLVHQMRVVPGGIARMIEHWVEQYHQEAAALMKLWGPSPYKKQAEYTARRDQMKSHEETVVARGKIDKSKRKQKRKRNPACSRENIRVTRVRALDKMD